MPVDPVITKTGAGRFAMIFSNRVAQLVGDIGITSAVGGGTAATLESPNLKDRMHRSYQ
ncbi:ATP-binding protein [Burkholderia sp. M6-3]